MRYLVLLCTVGAGNIPSIYGAVTEAPTPNTVNWLSTGAVGLLAGVLWRLWLRDQKKLDMLAAELREKDKEDRSMIIPTLTRSIDLFTDLKPLLERNNRLLESVEQFLRERFTK